MKGKKKGKMMRSIYVAWLEDSAGNLVGEPRMISSPIEHYHSLRMFLQSDESVKSPIRCFSDDYYVVVVDCIEGRTTRTNVSDIKNARSEGSEEAPLEEKNDEQVK